MGEACTINTTKKQYTDRTQFSHNQNLDIIRTKNPAWKKVNRADQTKVYIQIVVLKSSMKYCFVVLYFLCCYASFIQATLITSTDLWFNKNMFSDIDFCS
jgi:hypothetical protein